MSNLNANYLLISKPGAPANRYINLDVVSSVEVSNNPGGLPAKFNVPVVQLHTPAGPLVVESLGSMNEVEQFLMRHFGIEFKPA